MATMNLGAGGVLVAGPGGSVEHYAAGGVEADIVLLHEQIEAFPNAPDLAACDPIGNEDKRDKYTRDGLIVALNRISTGQGLPAPLPSPPEIAGPPPELFEAPQVAERQTRMAKLINRGREYRQKVGLYLGLSHVSWERPEEPVSPPIEEQQRNQHPAIIGLLDPALQPPRRRSLHTAGR